MAAADSGFTPVVVSLNQSGEQVTGASPAGSRAGEMNATVEALNEIVSVLRELKEENQDLREQVKEANRDLTEMQFRIDTHSKSFRPMREAAGSATQLDSGPPSSHPLLPPKRRP
jgi:methyl-accepting chemotaxis protein